MSDTSPEFQQALKRFQKGDKLGAENLLRQVASDTKFLHGSQSPEFAQAYYELASILNAMGRKRDAAEAMRAAASVNIPDSHQVTRNRLTYFTDLGSILGELDDVNEANQVLRQALTLRSDFYGNDHSGYAFGLEPLAVLTLKAGHFPEALKMIDQTISIFWKDGHPRVATAFPWRALILKLMGNKNSAFVGLEDVPDEIMGEMVANVKSVVSKEQAVAGQALVFDFLQVIQERFGQQHQLSVDLQTILAGIQRWIGPSEGRIESLERLATSLLKQRKIPEALEALQGLAEAFAELKDNKAAGKVYRQACQIAKQSQDAEEEARVLRNFGLFCVQIKNTSEAEKLLRMAVAAAKRSDEPTLFGRTLVALGIFLQHQDQLEEAERLLQVGLRSLPPADSDYICGNSHLQAILTGDSCPCGDPKTAFREALRSHLLKALPRQFVKDVHVEETDKGVQVRLDYPRDLNPQEMEELGRAMDQANIDFQDQLKRDL